MSIDALSAVGSIAPVAAIVPPEVDALFAAPATGPAAGNFASWFSKEVGAVNGKLTGAEQEIEQVALGGQQSLHDVMIHLEEARLSFQLLAQVRNRLLEAYQDVMRMQV